MLPRKSTGRAILRLAKVNNTKKKFLPVLRQKPTEILL